MQFGKPSWTKPIGHGLSWKAVGAGLSWTLLSTSSAAPFGQPIWWKAMALGAARSNGSPSWQETNTHSHSPLHVQHHMLTATRSLPMLTITHSLSQHPKLTATHSLPCSLSQTHRHKPTGAQGRVVWVQSFRAETLGCRPVLWRTRSTHRRTTCSHCSSHGADQMSLHQPGRI